MRTTPSPLLALQQARRHLLEHGHCPTGLVDERLARFRRLYLEELDRRGIVPGAKLIPP